jgi:nucleotide-binding universal stress UspA family protein
MTVSSQKPGNRIQRILVAIDTSQPSRAALRAAVDLARRFEGELVGIFVEDENLLRMAAHAFTREIRQFSSGKSECTSDDIQRQLRVRAREAEQLVTTYARRAGIPHSFRVVRGQVNRALITAAVDIDLITLGRAGHMKTGHRTLGSTAQAILRDASRSVMVLDQGVQLHPPVLVLYDGSETARKALEIAGEMTRSTEYQPVSVMVLDPTDEASERLEKEALGILEDHDVHAAFQPADRFSAQHLVHVIENQRYGLVLAPAALLDRYPDELQRVLTGVVTPIIFVR